MPFGQVWCGSPLAEAAGGAGLVQCIERCELVVKRCETRLNQEANAPGVTRRGGV